MQGYATQICKSTGLYCKDEVVIINFATQLPLHKMSQAL